MKSQRRHELQENTLAMEFGKTMDFFRKHGTKIAVGLIVVGLVLLVVFYSRSKARETAARLQADFDAAMTNPQLSGEERLKLWESLANQDDDMQKAALATLELGNEYSRRMAVAGPGEDPAEWNDLAQKASGYYQQVIETYPAQKIAVAQAHLGLAKLAESRRDFDVARSQYEAILKFTDLSGHPVMLTAEKGIQNLKMLETPVEMATTAPAAETEGAEPPASQPPTPAEAATQPAEGMTSTTQPAD